MGMAQPPPPPYWPPARPLAWQSPGILVAIVLAVVLGIGFIVFLATGFGMAGFPTFIFAPFCAFFIVIIIVVALAASQGMGRSPIPPPPPIQQPMVPAGQQGPIGLNCPNCGAPPQNVDRFGVATCTYCNTRFLVR